VLRIFVIASVISATACTSIPVAPRSPERPSSGLARFMREGVSIPYSIAVLASHRPERRARVHRAALVLQDAVQDLVHWTDPPVRSDAARDVFFAYAHSLERHVTRLEVAARTHDAELAAHSLEAIRDACNHCHRFFRPANKISADVALDLFALELGGKHR
jgi:hypothetical protein